MGAATDSYTTMRSVNDLFTSFNEFSNIAEARCTIRISEEYVFTPDMSESVCGSSALASVLLQRDDS